MRALVEALVAARKANRSFPAGSEMGRSLPEFLKIGPARRMIGWRLTKPDCDWAVVEPTEKHQ
jgi:hypothetical protein